MRDESSKAIMEEIKAMCGLLCESCTDRNGKLRYKRRHQLDKIGEACACMLNHWELFCTFLTEPQADIDNLSLERLNKGVAKIRGHGIFVRSGETGEAVSTLLTVLHTAALNGISNLHRYAYDAAVYCRRQAVTKAHLARFAQEQTEGQLRAGRLNYADPALYADIELPEELLPWNYARAHA